MASLCILRRILSIAATKPWPAAVPKRFLWRFTLPRSRSPSMNSRPPSSCFTGCSTNSNVVCLPAWNPSGWVTAATLCWAISWAWTRTPSPVAVSNCWTTTWSAAGHAAKVAAATPRKKNTRHNRYPAQLAGARHRRRSHDGLALVPAHYHPNLRGTAPTGHLRRPQHGRALAPSDGLFATRQSQADLHQLQPSPQLPVRIPGRVARPLPAPSSSYHQRRHQETRTGRQLQELRPTLGLRA